MGQPVIFFDKTMDLFLYQNVTEPTRFRDGNRPSKPDYIFTEEENLVQSIQIEALLGKSDHASITFECQLGVEISDDVTVKHDYWKAD